MNPYQHAKERLKKNREMGTGFKSRVSSGKDALGRPRYSKTPSTVRNADMIRGLTDEEFEQLRIRGELPKFLGSQRKTYAKNTEGLRLLAIAGGKREFLGTFVGDAVKLIHEGKIRDVAAMGRAGIKALGVLEAANIIDPGTGIVDRRAIEESLKKGRLMRGKM